MVAIRKGKTTVPAGGTINRSVLSDGPYLFRSYKPDESQFNHERPPLNYGVDINHDIWQVCRATTAATYYFEPQEIGDADFCDGGAVVNNPTLKALDEMDSLHEYAVKIVASFGTGKPEHHSLLGPRAHKLNVAAAWAEVNRVFKTLKAHLTECEEKHEQVEAQARRAKDGPGSFEYFRFNVEQDLGKVDMNEWKDRREDKRAGGPGGKCSTLEYIRRCTVTELEIPLVQQQFLELATMLVKRRRERVRDDRDRWERYACCTRYRCFDAECRVDGEILAVPMRREMQEHLERVHRVQPDSLQSRLDRCRELPDFPTGPF